MSEPTVAGACLCGEVEFTVRMPTSFCGHCHCTMCQRNHGAAYVTWLVVPKVQLVIDKGEQTLERYASSEHGARSFCRRCGSSLFCQNTQHPDDVDIVLANLKGPIDRDPELHIYWGDRVTWTRPDDGLPRLGGESGKEPVKEENSR